MNISINDFKTLAPSMNLDTLSRIKNIMMHDSLDKADALKDKIEESEGETKNILQDLRNAYLKDVDTIFTIYRKYAK